MTLLPLLLIVPAGTTDAVFGILVRFCFWKELQIKMFGNACFRGTMSSLRIDPGGIVTISFDFLPTSAAIPKRSSDCVGDVRRECTGFDEIWPFDALCQMPN